MADEKYQVPKDPAYRAADIRRIQNEDPINADESMNPIIEAILECLQFLYLNRASLDSAGKVPSDQLPAMDFDKAGAAAVVSSLLKEHTGNKSNPHDVTAVQVGAALANHKHSAADVGAASSSHTHTDKQDKVTASTTDLTAGSSALATGALYAVYE